MTFSEKLAAAMRDKQISIRELSDKTGIPKSAIQRYTSGDTEKIPIDRMMKMAEALNVDPAYIMGWETPLLFKELSSTFGPDSPTAKKLQHIRDHLAVPGLDALPQDAKDERELLDIFHSLNDNGRSSMLNYARFLNSNPDMKKDATSNDMKG